MVATPAAVAGDADKGRAIAEQHCSRCHVVAAHNPMGGANNTASFQMIIKMDDGLERFQPFYARRPHPVFLRIPGVARWSNAPANAAEITITLEQVDDIVAFAKTLEKVPIRRKGDRP
jgi:mono/diheme cytochrome c family protein